MIHSQDFHAGCSAAIHDLYIGVLKLCHDKPILEIKQVSKLSQNDEPLHHEDVQPTSAERGTRHPTDVEKLLHA